MFFILLTRTRWTAVSRSTISPKEPVSWSTTSPPFPSRLTNPTPAKPRRMGITGRDWGKALLPFARGILGVMAHILEALLAKVEEFWLDRAATSARVARAWVPGRTGTPSGASRGLWICCWARCCIRRRMIRTAACRPCRSDIFENYYPQGLCYYSGIIRHEESNNPSSQQPTSDCLITLRHPFAAKQQQTCCDVMLIFGKVPSSFSHGLFFIQVHMFIYLFSFN